MPQTIRLLVATLVLAFVLPAPAAAQGGLLGRVKRKAEETAKRRTDEKVDRAAENAANKAVDAAEDAVSCTVADKACAAQAERDGKDVILTDEEGTPLPASKQPPRRARPAPADGGTAESPEAGPPAKPLAPGEGAWANYDFLPGERPLRVADLRNDVVGDFPRALEFVSGNMEVVEWNGGRWLRVNGSANRFLIPAGGPLPARWTLEFRFAANRGECWLYPKGEQSGAYIWFGAWADGGVVFADGRSAGTRSKSSVDGEPFNARVMVDGRYAKVYVNERRVANLPNFDYEHGPGLLVWCDGSEEDPVLLGDFRLAAGGRKLYDALAERGRVATQGIYFDTGSDRIRPESTPTLKEIAAMLAEHPDLSLLIEGHTDNVGAAAANQTLSERRAAAVKASLVAQFGAPAARLATAGFGASKPAAPNTTDEGRQQNRRVELVRR